MTTNAFRRAARITALAATLTVLLAASPALADTPERWADAAPMSTLKALLIFVGGPLVLFVVISTLALAPSLIRGDRRQRGVTSWSDPAWFGNEVARSEGPAQGELESGDAQTGGASARW
ncbi:MAG: hypothetical protein ACRDO1_09720 [Nocardioidaceae bacterium]